MTMESELDREIQRRIDIALENEEMQKHAAFVERTIEQALENEEAEMLEVQLQIETIVFAFCCF